MGAHPAGGDRAAVERILAELIRALGLDPASEPELAATPSRLADFYAEAFSGIDPQRVPDVQVFPSAPDAPLVIVRGLRFHSMCVHHFAPFFGRAHVAYLPSDRIVGISGPARLLDHYARRPQLQERLTSQLADHLERLLEPRGLAVTLRARHLCMEMRGVRRHATIETRVRRGALAEPGWADPIG